MTAPNFRAVEQHTGDVERPSAFFAALAEADKRICICPVYARDPKCPKDHSVEQALAEARAELDDAMTQLRIVTDSNAGLAKFANIYHIERDEWRERADEWREKAESYLATIDDLQAEVRDLRADL